MTSNTASEVKTILAAAASLAAAGQSASADLMYQKAANEHLDSSDAQHALGIFRFQQGRLELAAQSVARAVLLAPGNAVFQRDLGELSRRLGRLDLARDSTLAATKLAPDDAGGFYNLGLIYTDQNDFEQAARAYRRAIKLDSKHTNAWNNLGSALENQGEINAARDAYQRAVALDATNFQAFNNLGALCVADGLLPQAREHFTKAIALRPDFIEAHFNLSTLKKYTRDDPHLEQLLALAPRAAEIAVVTRVQYWFALAKALDDAGEFDAAFSAYESANQLHAELEPFDEMAADRYFHAVLKTCSAAFFAKRGQWQGYADHRVPVFIIGMPRSGTSLLEQILDSHPSIYGAGELSDFDVCLREALDPQQAHGVALEKLDEAAFRKIGKRYIERVWERSPQSSYITDKMPANFFHIGLIKLALPHAVFIHASRDPMDSCFSCYTRHFTSTMTFTYDLGTLGRYYGRYAKLMDHWRAVLPKDTILDVTYESVVANVEQEARRVIAFLGLLWDPQCLEFHKNTRTVATASLAQVRQPIYSSSIGRWKNFAAHLQLLWQHVGPVRGASDLTPELLAVLQSKPVKKPFAVARSANSWFTEGLELYRQGRLADSLLCYDHALSANPNADTVYNSKGYVLQEMGRIEEAVDCLEECVRLAPGNVIGRLNLAMAQLKLGRWDAGWDNYEARWTGSAESMQGTLNRAVSPLPQWNGETDTAHLRLLVIAEQGFGDIFQFSRYLDLALGRFARVGFACSPPTLRLLEQSFGDRIALFVRMPAQLGDWDLQCPLLSLPRAFKTQPDQVPSGDPPYLRASAPAHRFWAERLARYATKPMRIGIAWAGRKTHQQDLRRSISFDLLRPLLDDVRVSWVSLQKWAPEDLRPQIFEGVEWHDWTDELMDFADTAALVSNLDLVISVDSSMVHLAGALGRPVWMLNRFDGEWRWFHQVPTSPWYPTLTIFNQPQAGDWTSAILHMKGALLARPVDSPSQSGPAAPKGLPALAGPAASSVAGLPAAVSASVPAPASVPAASPTAPAPASLSVREALDAAARYDIAGQFQQMEHLLRQVLAVEPEQPHALHMLGLLSYRFGHSKAASDLVTRAIRGNPNVAMFHCNLTEMLRQQGRLEEAILAGQRAIELDPSLPAAHCNLGIALYDAEDFDAAEDRQRRAVELDPSFLPALNNLGSIERKRKNLFEAANWYRRVIAVNPDYLETLSNLGAVLFEDERPEEAITPLEHALSLKPDYPEALCNLGLAHLEADRAERASPLLRRSLQLRPDHIEALQGLAATCQFLDQREEALALLYRTVEVAPQSASAHGQLGTLLMQLARAPEARLHFEKTLELDPNNTEAITGLGALMLEEGRLEEAEASYRLALRIDPLSVGACFHLAYARKITADDPVIERLAAVAALDKLNPSKRITLHYARGKVLDDLGQYEEAFEDYLKGASLRRSQIHHDAERDTVRARRVAELIDSKFLDRMEGAGNASKAPIFILGMPRSGTTLTEQIIASHSQVFGAGELDTLMDVVQQLKSKGSEAVFFPENLIGIKRKTIKTWAEDYLAGVPPLPDGTSRFTDKMPANYFALGLITAMLPNAKIIHVKRDPIDTCVSCFTRLFGWTQPATYNLTELGRHYVDYAKLMEHWRSVLPGRFYEIQYEDVVADIDTQARRLIEYCELDWQDACLSFHKTKRSVRTASVTQVRQPIYGSSVQRWKRVERFLGPLIESLGDYASFR